MNAFAHRHSTTGWMSSGPICCRCCKRSDDRPWPPPDSGSWNGVAFCVMQGFIQAHLIGFIRLCYIEWLEMTTGDMYMCVHKFLGLGWVYIGIHFSLERRLMSLILSSNTFDLICRNWVHRRHIRGWEPILVLRNIWICLLLHQTTGSSRSLLSTQYSSEFPRSEGMPGIKPGWHLLYATDVARPPSYGWHFPHI